MLCLLCKIASPHEKMAVCLSCYTKKVLPLKKTRITKPIYESPCDDW